MNKGWIAIHRAIQDCWIWTFNEPFDKRSAWIDLLLLANHADKKLYISGEPVIISRGQFHTSVVKLADRWSWSRNKVIRYLALLERDHMITINGTPNGTTISIVNYGKFQDMRTPYETPNETTDETPSGTTGETTDGTQTTIKQLNNVNNVNNNMGRFTPPTLEEVEAYCFERNNNVDAQSFIDFYSAKGWMIGKNKMKDWKAAVRTWEKNDRKKTKTIDWESI